MEMNWSGQEIVIRRKTEKKYIQDWRLWLLWYNLSRLKEDILKDSWGKLENNRTFEIKMMIKENQPETGMSMMSKF